MSNHHISIIYKEGNSQANLSFNQESDRILASKGDTLSFSFDGPDQLNDAVLLVGPRRKQAARSPFDGGNQINIEPEAKYTIDQANGLWGFSVSFSTVNKDGISQFYFLPDPELQVGSNLSLSSS